MALGTGKATEKHIRFLKVTAPVFSDIRKQGKIPVKKRFCKGGFHSGITEVFSRYGKNERKGGGHGGRWTLFPKEGHTGLPAA